jgi:hypothetical protein
MDFFPQRSDRGPMRQTCAFIEKAAHTLLLASRRQHMTTSELRAQVGVLPQWRTALDAQRASPPPPDSPPEAERRHHGLAHWCANDSAELQSHSCSYHQANAFACPARPLRNIRSHILPIFDGRTCVRKYPGGITHAPHRTWRCTTNACAGAAACGATSGRASHRIGGLAHWEAPT